MSDKNYFVCLGSVNHRQYLIQGNIVVWTARREAKVGDMIFFYITAPVSAIVAYGFVLDDPFRNQEFGSRWEGRWMAEIGVHNPALNLPYKQLCEIFPDWRWLIYPRSNTQIPAEIVKPFLELISGT